MQANVMGSLEAGVWKSGCVWIKWDNCKKWHEMGQIDKFKLIEHTIWQGRTKQKLKIGPVGLGIFTFPYQ